VSEHIDDQNRTGAEGAPGRYAECAYVQDLAAGFALGALEPDEEQQVRDHLAACRACERVVERIRQAVAMLPFASAPAVPPLHAKAALFSRIAQSSRPQTVPAASMTIPASHVETTVSQTTRRWQIPFVGRGNHTGRFNLPAFATPLATVPLVIALALVGSFALSSQSKVGDLRSELLSARSDLDNAHEALDAVDNFPTTDDTEVYELPGQGTKNNGSAHGKVIANPGTTDAMLMIWQLSNEPKGCTYEVVLEDDDGSVVHAGDFGVDNEGNGATRLSLTQPFNTYRVVHIKRKYTTTDVVGTQVPTDDALVAVIDLNSNPVYDRIATTTQ